MKSRIIYLLSAITVITSPLRAQQEKPSFGLTAGASFASIKVTVDKVSVAYDTKVGFSAGLIGNIPLNRNIIFQPELQYIGEGGKFTSTADNIKETISYYYVQMPLNFIYNVHASKGAFFFGAGPSFNLGLSGTYEMSGASGEHGDIKFGSADSSDLKPFEIAANFLAGYRFNNGFLVMANYQFGLNSISPVSDYGYYNRCFGIKVGYLFGKKK